MTKDATVAGDAAKIKGASAVQTLTKVEVDLETAEKQKNHIQTQAVAEEHSQDKQIEMVQVKKNNEVTKIWTIQEAKQQAAAASITATKNKLTQAKMVARVAEKSKTSAASMEATVTKKVAATQEALKAAEQEENNSEMVSQKAADKKTQVENETENADKSANEEQKVCRQYGLHRVSFLNISMVLCCWQ